MTMPGGGHFDVGPGQVTDDSELAFQLMTGIIESLKPGVLDVERIARNYSRWVQSGPFDIGGTTKSTLGKLTTDCRASVAREAAKASQAIRPSLSNGSLMRITPLAVWAAGIDDPVLFYRVIAADVTFTHASPLVSDAVAVYSRAIATLLRNADDEQKVQIAFDRATEMASTIANTVVESDDRLRCTVKGWLEQAMAMHVEVQNGKSDAEVVAQLNVREKVGWCRHGFILAFFFLLRMQNGMTYAKAMEETIRPGGDTDTNAAIVGGMLGAVVGITGIP